MSDEKRIHFATSIDENVVTLEVTLPTREEALRFLAALEDGLLVGKLFISFDEPSAAEVKH